MNPIGIYIPCVLPSENLLWCIGYVFKNTGLPYTLTVIAQGESVSRNRNLGLGLSGHRWTCFLDDDILVKRGWLETMLQTAESSKDIGMVGVKIVQKGTGEIISCGTGWDGAPIMAGITNIGQRKVVEEVNGVAEACILVRSDTLRFCNLLKCHEGLDLSIRLRKMGLKTIYDGRVKVHHVGKLTKRKPLNFSHILFHARHPSTFPHPK